MDLNLNLAFAEEVARSGQKYRKEILTMPYSVLEGTLQNMTYVPGLHGKETTPYVKSGAQLMPYRSTETVTNTTVFAERTLETYHADVEEEFDPAGV